MRAYLLLLLLILIGIYVGREIWPEAPSDPDAFSQYHRGKIPAEAGETAIGVRGTDPHPHHRVFPVDGTQTP